MRLTSFFSSPIKTAVSGAYLTIIGILVSGPIGLIIVSAIQPAPPWEAPLVYVQHYHPVQIFPFLGGIFLVSGYVIMISGFYMLAEEIYKTAMLIAVVFTSVFAAFIFLNYVTQTTFIPALVRNYTPEAGPAISIFSLSNPESLAWAIEMWGYGFLGFATLLSARLFNRNSLERVTAWLLILNFIISILGIFAVIRDLSWVFTDTGLWSYIIWNLLVLNISILVVITLKRRIAGEL
jgi:hypothetical protein